MRSRSRAAVAALAVLMFGAAALLYRLGRGLTFYYDEWAFVMHRRDWSVDAFLEPHNEHLSLVPAAVFKTLFVTVGLEDYRPYRLAVIVLHLALAGLIFVVVRRRAGDVLGVAAASLLLFLGAGWENMLWPFQIGFIGALLAGLAALELLERRDLRSDVAASACLAAALASSSLGVPLALAAAVQLGWDRARPRRFWTLAIPLAAYAVWYAVYGRSDAAVSNLPEVPAYVANALAAVLAALTGLGTGWGQPLAVAAVLFLLLRIFRPAALTPRLAALLCAALSFWALAGLARAELADPTSSRYVYVGAVFVVLIAAELLRDTELTRPALALVGVLVAVSAVANYRSLVTGVDHLRGYSSFVAAELGALELAGPTTAPDFRPDPVRAPDIAAGPYFAAVEQLGSPADTPAEIRARPEPERLAADAVLIAALRVQAEPGAPTDGRGRPPAVDAVDRRSVRSADSCVTFAPDPGGGAVTVAVTAPLVVRAGTAPVEVRLKLFASEFPKAALAVVARETAATIAVPLEQPWRAHLRSSGQTRICMAARSE